MKLRNILWFLLLCLGLLANCSRSEASFHDHKGNTIPLSQFKNKWVILNFWAAWCSACIEEMPELNQFYLRNKDKNILIYGVNFDQLSGDSLMQAVNEAKVMFPTLIENPSYFWNLDEVSVLPVTFIIRPNGEIAKKIIGPNTARDLAMTMHSLQQ